MGPDVTSHNIHYQKFSIGSLLIAFGGGCGPQGRAFPAPDDGLVVDVTGLSIGPVAFDATGSAVLRVENGGAAERMVLARVDDPAGAFSLVSSPTDEAGWRLQPGEDLDLEVAFSPTAAGPILSTLELSAPDLPDGAVQVGLTGLVDPDGDDDGASHPLAGGQDCDDQDATVGPDATESWYDGIDQDCDGNDDDADGDGSPQGLDCDDQDDARSPDLAETWYDGVDQDCDGNDDDADGDGVPGGGGADCDDLDADILPGAEDRRDLVDQDCDGIVDEDGAVEGSATFSELYPEISSKSGTWDEFLELYLTLPIGLDGWELTSSRGSGTLELRVEEPGAWVLLCSEGLAAVVTACAAVVDPWPVTSREAETLTLSVAGQPIDVVAWDATWGLATHGLQVDRDLVGSATIDDDPAAWCAEDPSPGTENLPCP